MSKDSVWRALATRVPELVVLGLLVYVFLGHLERVEARRGEVLGLIGQACHVHQKQVIDEVTYAMEQQTDTNRAVHDVLIEIATLLRAGRGLTGEQWRRRDQ